MPFEEHKCFKTPTDDTAIYKYMSFYKFFSLINKSQIFFCRADKFEDPMEGCYPRRINELSVPDWHELYKETYPEKPNHNSFAQSTYDLIRDSHKKRSQYAICSFCASSHEDDALWKLYSEKSTGICVKTSISRFKQAISKAKPSVHIGEVKYYSEEDPRTYLNEPILLNLFQPYLLKRREYQAENEVRALVTNKSFFKSAIDFNSESGVFIDVNLSDLICEIILSPASTNDFKETVSSMVEKYGISAPIRKSTLYEPAF
jgi:hypothetical protein